MKYLLIFICCLAHPYLLSQQTASGIILDKGDNMPMIGVSISVKGAGHIGDIAFDDPRMVYPIPQREMEVNGALVQNDGY